MFPSIAAATQSSGQSPSALYSEKSGGWLWKVVLSGTLGMSGTLETVTLLSPSIAAIACSLVQTPSARYSEEVRELVEEGGQAGAVGNFGDIGDSVLAIHGVKPGGHVGDVDGE